MVDLTCLGDYLVSALAFTFEIYEEKEKQTILSR